MPLAAGAPFHDVPLLPSCICFLRQFFPATNRLQSGFNTFFLFFYSQIINIFLFNVYIFIANCLIVNFRF